MCRLQRGIQYEDKTSAEDDNWDYDKIQSKNNKMKADYIYVTILVNNPPRKFILVTLRPQRIFNSILKVEKLNTNCEDVNDNKIEFVGQTTATVKINETTLQLPLLFTKANITPLMGLDWMKQLQITFSANTEEIEFHNIRLDESETKNIKLENEFKDLFYNNNEIKDLVVKVSLKEDTNIIQQKGRPIPIHLQDQVAEELKTLIKKSYLERATELTKDCRVSPAVKTVG